MADAYICRRGGSGGSGGSELVIVGGTTRPAKTTHNMIWLNTPNEITSYVLIATEPEIPVAGMAWITIGDSGVIKATTPIGGDWITVYPLNAKQYISGAWVDVSAKSYQDGEWVDWWGGYYFRDGEQYQAYTGGWTGAAGANSSYEVGATLHLRNNGSDHAWVGTANRVDLTNVDTLYATVIKDDGSYSVYMMVGKERTNWVNDAKRVSHSNGLYTYDVSDLIGDYYIYFNGSGGANGVADTQIGAVWGE